MLVWCQLVKKEISFYVQCIRLDNSGENRSFHKKVQKSKYIIIFEFTAPGTPHQNGNVECAIATLYGKTRSMINSAGFLQLSDKDFGQAAQA
jgi:hypothetical protein